MAPPWFRWLRSQHTPNITDMANLKFCFLLSDYQLSCNHAFTREINRTDILKVNTLADGAKLQEMIIKELLLDLTVSYILLMWKQMESKYTIVRKQTIVLVKVKEKEQSNIQSYMYLLWNRPTLTFLGSKNPLKYPTLSPSITTSYGPVLLMNCSILEGILFSCWGTTWSIKFPAEEKHFTCFRPLWFFHRCLAREFFNSSSSKAENSPVSSFCLHAWQWNLV